MALGSMVCNLTTGKKKYAQYEEDIQAILGKAKTLQDQLLEMIDKDAEGFFPLSQAYGLPANTDEEKAAKEVELERCLKLACEVPFKIVELCNESIKLHEELGIRKVPFGRELYIEREDFMEEPPKKYFRLFPGNEVRLMHAYFVKCESFVKDENGKITEVHCTYDPETKAGSGFTGRKVKGTIHWVPAEYAQKAEVRLYENLIDEEKGVYNKEDGSLNLNPNSLTIIKDAYVEPSFDGAKAYDSFQFVRNGYFCVDSHDSEPDHLVFNRIVSLKSSFKLPK